MFVARIDGHLHSSHKHAALTGARFLLAQRLGADGVASGEPMLVIDWLGAGQGSTVLVCNEGLMARRKFGNQVPARLVVAAIVDEAGAR